MAGLYAPLPTLRRRPRGRLRTDRGRRGLLLLHRSGLSPHTPCQSPGALTRVAACTLARSPYIVTAIRRLQTLRLLHACSGRFRLERLPGGACTHWKSAALSRRTWTNGPQGRRILEPDQNRYRKCRREITESQRQVASSAGAPADLSSRRKSQGWRP